ncbi:MAG: OmpH family outer membrane protein [Gammaproteobacteria bacterium]|nr:OmpH family outer membrane protein [Gammaproteobacteria bacterium]
MSDTVHKKSKGCWRAVSLGLLLSVYTLAVDAAEFKIGFVNAPRVLEEAPQAEAARDRLEKEFSPRDKKLVASQKDMRDLEDKLTRDGAIMSESERRKLERDIISRKRELKRGQDEFREDLNIRRNEAFDKLRRRVFEVISDIAKKQNYDLVLSDGVVYSSDRVDISDQVLGRLKQEFNQGAKK